MTLYPHEVKLFMDERGVPQLLGKLAVKLNDGYMIGEIRDRLGKRTEARTYLHEVLPGLRADLRNYMRNDALVAEKVLSEGLFGKYLTHERLSNFLLA